MFALMGGMWLFIAVYAGTAHHPENMVIEVTARSATAAGSALVAVDGANQSVRASWEELNDAAVAARRSQYSTTRSR